jgi:hypothetical protein
MELDSLKEHLDRRLDKLEDKLDDHLERISKAETSIEWIRGHLKVSLSIAVAAVTGLAGAIFTYFIEG